MELKTKIHAENDRHDLTITREFDLPVELLFKAHVEPELFERWMSHEYGTVKVLQYEGKKQGAWKFQNTDLQGNVLFSAEGVIHEFIPDKKITRTFEAGGSPFDAQLEFLEFEKLTADTSKLTIHTIYRTVEFRDQMLKLPFAQGLSMAHNRLEQVISKLK